MSIIIFIVILAVLVLVHELGHFFVAKKTGMRVDEFGLGLPPRAIKLWKKGDTEYTLNWIPFGGFVKIFGENPEEEIVISTDSERSLANKPKWQQASVLVAGVAANIVFAWALITTGFISGMPSPVDYTNAGEVRDAKLLIVGITADSPAEKSGLRSGDEIISFKSKKETLTNPSPEKVYDFIQAHGEEELLVSYKRGGSEEKVASVTPVGGIINGGKAIGVSMDMIGILKLPFFQAIWEGAKTTYHLTVSVAVGLALFIKDAFVGQSDFSQVTGPVGIVGLVGNVSELGFIYLLSFTAFISINLAVINIIPFPALDGGRLLFVLIETIKRSRINPKVANTLNGIGFVLLIILMIAVTFNDVIRIFNG